MMLRHRQPDYSDKNGSHILCFTEDKVQRVIQVAAIVTSHCNTVTIDTYHHGCRAVYNTVHLIHKESRAVEDAYCNHIPTVSSNHGNSNCRDILKVEKKMIKIFCKHYSSRNYY